MRHLLLQTDDGMDVVNVSVQVTTSKGQARKSFWIPAADMEHVTDALSGVLESHAVFGPGDREFRERIDRDSGL